MESILSTTPSSQVFNYIESNREEYRLSNDLTKIVLTFPSFTEQSWARARGRYMKIDHCVVECNIDLHYFSSSFFSIKDENPWALYYKVEGSNVNIGTHFAKFKAKLKMSTAKHSVDVIFKPPIVKIHPKEFNSQHVDFSHVGLQTSMLDPGHSASVIGANRAHSNLSLSRNELEELVARVVQTCINQNNSANVTKPL
ncbi:hypothetical protein GQ457_06G010890 [Hibiscus cannabinus]